LVELTGGNDKIIKIEQLGHAEDRPLFGLPVLADPTFLSSDKFYTA
jgi:hypothetical protein